MNQQHILLTIISLGLSHSTLLSKDQLDIQDLTSEPDLWYLSEKKISQQFPRFSWTKGKVEGEFIDQSAGLTMLGEAIENIKLKQERGRASSLKLTIVSPKSASTLSKQEFNAQAAAWNTLLAKHLKSQGKRVDAISYGPLKLNRIAWKRGESVVILSAGQADKPVSLEVTFYQLDKGLNVLKLSGQQDKVAEDKPKVKPLKDAELSDEESSEDFAPREIKAAIRSTIKEIESRNPKDGISKKVQDAVNLLNVYRFLSGVHYDVEADEDYTAAAEDAAGICKKNGKLSHGFGHSTEKCNLAMSTRDLSMESSVTQYMNDSGANNREKRGHRKWCLNPKMEKTGFGIDGAFSAMYSLDQSGKAGRENYSYPGHGFYPLDYLHGNGWSYYLAEGAAPENCEVQVWKLKSFQEKAPSWGKDPEGTELKVGFKHIFRNSVVFEPDPQPITKKGSYLVRLKGSGLREQYLVHLY